MFNKFSFLPNESLYPICLNLDDFEDDGAIIPQKKAKQNLDRDYTKEYLRCEDLKKKLWNDSITKEELRELSAIIQKNKKEFLSTNIDTPIRDYIFKLLTSAEKGDLFRAAMFWLAHDMRIWITDASKTNDEYSPDWFGKYCSDNGSDYFPVIYLNKERIEQGKELLCNEYKVHLDRNMLYAVVLIFALVYAVMDPANKLDNDGNLLSHSERCKQQEINEADVFDQKVLATISTLHYFDEYDQNQYRQVREYFSVLSMPYKVGLAEYETLRETKCRWEKIAATQCYYPTPMYAL